MWVAYLDFMRQQWPSIEEVEDLENRYKEFNSLSCPYKSAYNEWLGLKAPQNSAMGPYKKKKF